jgi:hypothetical protein
VEFREHDTEIHGCTSNYPQREYVLMRATAPSEGRCGAKSALLGAGKSSLAENRAPHQHTSALPNSPTVSRPLRFEIIFIHS